MHPIWDKVWSKNLRVSRSTCAKLERLRVRGARPDGRRAQPEGRRQSKFGHGIFGLARGRRRQTTVCPTRRSAVAPHRGHQVGPTQAAATGIIVDRATAALCGSRCFAKSTRCPALSTGIRQVRDPSIELRDRVDQSCPVTSSGARTNVRPTPEEDGAGKAVPIAVEERRRAQLAPRSDRRKSRRRSPSTPRSRTVPAARVAGSRRSRRRGHLSVI